MNYFNTLLLILAINISLPAQENLSITAPGIIPAPLDLEANGGVGCYFFSIQNVNLPGYPNAGDTQILIEQNNITPPNGLADLSSDLTDSHYSWSYDAATNTFTGEQILPIGFLYSEVITVCFEVTTDSACPIENNGHTVTGIVINGDDGNLDDNVAASYTCTDDLSALPVELIGFIAKKKGNTSLLKWVTASEVNNSHFIVERSRDGVHFEEIARVEGKGTTLDLSHYTYEDKRPMAGWNYYRLNQIDTDGANQFSSTISLDFRSESVDVKIYPNPARMFVNIDNISDGSRIHVYNMTGQRVMETEIINGQVSTAHLGTGTYIFRGENAQGSFSFAEKILITNN